MQEQLTAEQAIIKNRVEQHVMQLAHTIGERNFRHYENLTQAANYIERTFIDLGYLPVRQYFDYEQQSFCNIEAEKNGAVHPEKIILVGAHYDTAKGTTGANANGTGVAALLELARLLAPYETVCTIRFVAFANEEPPFIRTKHMGSYCHAERAQSRKENIVGMLSLETIGYYSDEKGSQKLAYLLPKTLYPDRGNFIAFIGNLASRTFLEKLQNAFANVIDFPCQTLTAPGWLWGINSSDQWSFWQHNYPAVMITDTAPFRYRHYHKSTDTCDKVNCPRVAVLISGLAQALKLLAEGN